MARMPRGKISHWNICGMNQPFSKSKDWTLGFNGKTVKVFARRRHGTVAGALCDFKFGNSLLGRVGGILGYWAIVRACGVWRDKAQEFRVEQWSEEGWQGGLDLQLGKLLAELPGVGLDPADGIVAEVELL